MIIDASTIDDGIGKIIIVLIVNRYRTVWRFKGHANSRARISVEEWEA